MRRRRRNSESQIVSALRSGQLTPAAVRSHIARLHAELDDARFFQYPAGEIERLEEEVRSLEESIAAGEQAFEEGAKERAAAYAKDLAKEDAGDKLIDETPGHVLLSRKLNSLTMRLRVLQTDLREAIRFRDPEPELDRLRTKIQETRQEIQETEIALSQTKANPRRKRRVRFAEVARQDLNDGKLSTSDLSRRLARFKRLLDETRVVDPKANKRIKLLSERVKTLEEIIREQRDKRAV